MTTDEDYSDIVALKRALGKRPRADSLTVVLVRRASERDRDDRNAEMKRWVDAVHAPCEVAP